MLPGMRFDFAKGKLEQTVGTVQCLLDAFAADYDYGRAHGLGPGGPSPAAPRRL